MVRSVETVHLYCVKISTISKYTETKILHDPRHLAVPLCVQNDFQACGTFGPYSAPILHRH
jgi:hypothetical protein